MPAEPIWHKCDECNVPYVIVAILNPRRHKWAPLPLSLASSLSEGVVGNFDINWDADSVEVFDADERDLGPCPVGIYGVGEYRPHAPTHFLDHHHGEDRPRQRLGNFRLAMDDDD
jgi:hypothetical protein